jgi:hypothetical protein
MNYDFLHPMLYNDGDFDDDFRKYMSLIGNERHKMVPVLYSEHSDGTEVSDANLTRFFEKCWQEAGGATLFLFGKSHDPYKKYKEHIKRFRRAVNNALNRIGPSSQ